MSTFPGGFASAALSSDLSNRTVVFAFSIFRGPSGAKIPQECIEHEQ